MPSWIHVVVLALATWRLASLLAHEDGPLEMFGYLRSRLGVRYDKHSIPYGGNWLAKGVICVWCCSVWFGVFLAGLYSIGWRLKFRPTFIYKGGIITPP